jgi:hypothetical protein
MTDFFGQLGAGLSIIIVKTLFGIIVGGIGGILAAIFKLALTVVDYAVNGTKALLFSGPIDTAWHIMLDATNVLLFLALAIMAIMIIAGLQNYNIKKALSALIYAIVVANLSYEIVKLVVGMGDALRAGIQSAFMSLGATQDPFSQWRAGMSAIWSTGNLLDNPSWQELGKIVIVGLAVVGSLAISAYAMVKLAVLLLERAVRLIIAVVFAPLVFILQLFPGVGLDGLAKTWWSDLIKWVLILPVVYFMLGVAGLLLPSNVENLNLPTQIETAINQNGEESSSQNEDFGLNLMLIIASLGITLAAGSSAKLLSLGNIAVEGGFNKIVGGGLNKAKDYGLNAFNYERGKAINRAAEGKLLNGIPVLNKLADTSFGRVVNKLGTGYGKGMQAIEGTLGRISQYGETAKKGQGELREKLVGESAERIVVTSRRQEIDRAAKLGGYSTKEFLQLDESTRNGLIKKVRDADPNFDERRKSAEKQYADKLKKDGEREASRGVNAVSTDLQEAYEKLQGHLNGRALSNADLTKYQIKYNKATEALNQIRSQGGVEGHQAEVVLTNTLGSSDGYAVSRLASGKRAIYSEIKPLPGDVSPQNIKREAEAEYKLVTIQPELIRTRTITEPTHPTTVGAAEASSASTVELLITKRTDERDESLDQLDRVLSGIANPRTKKEADKLIKDSIGRGELQEEISKIRAEIVGDDTASIAKRQTAIATAIRNRMQPSAELDNPGGTDLVNSLAYSVANGIDMKVTREATNLRKAIVREGGITPDLREFATNLHEAKQAQDTVGQLEKEQFGTYGVSTELQSRIAELSRDPSVAPLFTTRLAEVQDIVHKSFATVADPHEIDQKSMADLIKDPTEKAKYQTFMNDWFTTLGKDVRLQYAPQSDSTETAIRDIRGQQVAKMIFRATQRPRK